MAGKRTKPDPKGGGLGANSVEHVATADLIPYARNARTHSDEQVAQIAGSIQEFGFNNPVLIDKQNSIIAGHGRVLAAGRLKLEQVPCIRLTHLSDAQRRAYILADNRIAMNSGWDQELLANELSDLHADETDLGLLGFDPKELTELLNLSSDEWKGQPPADPAAIEDYDPEDETVSVRLNKVLVGDKDGLVALIEKALKQSEYKYAVEVF